MITFGLISLFIFTAVAAVISLGDSALRGARAFKQLSRAVQIERMDYAELVSATAADLAPPCVAQKSRSKPSASMDYLQLLPAAA
jgi:hypothetical protein